ncbi:MAG: chromosome partitioning protein ParB [Flammeovirgaceae bacterium]|nr:chromosome partitioning protein ParB [Flammeovirgaceae bacterium]
MAAKKNTGLGKGLGALLSESSSVVHEINAESVIRDRPAIGGEISISEIEVNPFQPRSYFNEEALNDLAQSIQVQGIIQPITVRKLSKNKYQLISGERRLQASKKAGLEKIPAYIRLADDQQMLEMALIENIQRENLNAIEIALSYQRLLSECDLKQEQLGDRVGKNRSTVTNYLRLLKLPPDIQIGLRDGLLSMGHARSLIAIDDIALQLEVFQKILTEGLSVRKTESVVRRLLNKKPNDKVEGAVMTSEIEKVQRQLSSHFGTMIKIKSKNNAKGEISIPFASFNELNRILDLLKI